MPDQPPMPIGPGYPLGRLEQAVAQALTATDPALRERAERRADAWRAVLSGMATGELDIGSRTPVVDTPPWVTLEVVTGGFATGRLLAETPLDDAERALLTALPADTPGRTDRERLNLWWLSDDGLRRLDAAVHRGHYGVELPEHAALPVVALLLARPAW